MSLSPQLAQPELHGHFLQFYKADEPSLTTNVTRFLAEGFQRHEALLVIATPRHGRSFKRRLKTLLPSLDSDTSDSPILFLDAQATLDRIVIAGQPDWDRFENVIAGAIRELRLRTGHSIVRAYGEMVGILWNSGNKASAIRLEQFWNRILEETGCSLYCGYPIDIFDPEFQSAEVHELLCAHTHLVPIGEKGDLDAALHRATGEVTGTVADLPIAPASGNGHGAHPLLSAAEASLFSLRTTLPDHADQILSRARQHYQVERRFRALVENSFDAISLLDRHGKVLYATASTAKVLGYEPTDLLGSSVFDLTHPDDLDQASKTLQQALANPDLPIHNELRLRRKDGQWAWIESTTANLLEQPDIRAFVSNYRDITERKTAEQEAQRQAEKLVRFNAELEAFTYAVTHDLKEPLRSVSVFTELLVQRSKPDEETQDLAGFIVDGVKRMSALLDDLLSFTSLKAHVKLQQTALRRAAERAIQNLDKIIHESSATVELGPLPLIEGHPNHLMQLFQNLIGNAIKYRSEEPPCIHITAERLGTECIIKVKDNGIGIAPEYREHVFGLFKRLHGRQIPGTGIGLAICKKIVDGMGGRIWVEPNGDHGSAFCFSVTPVDDCLETGAAFSLQSVTAQN